MTTPGRIEVIVGPMFYGKSEELIHRLKREFRCRTHFQPYLDENASEQLKPLAVNG